MNNTLPDISHVCVKVMICHFLVDFLLNDLTADQTLHLGLGNPISQRFYEMSDNLVFRWYSASNSAAQSRICPPFIYITDHIPRAVYIHIAKPVTIVPFPYILVTAA